tara:strand:- start:166 stop:1227 length:1062 start_codon:yes stop_codon:yes gene_type:complete
VDVTINGAPLVVKLADDESSRISGLMNALALDEDTGLLFRWPNSEPRSFWMKDTSIPLDIAYIAEDGKIINIEPMEPFSLKSVLSSEPAVCALEVNRGWFDKNGVIPGHVVHGVFNDMPKLSESALIKEADKFRLSAKDFYYQDVVDPVVDDVLSFLPNRMPNEELEYSSEYSWPYPVNIDAWAENWGEDSIPAFDVEIMIVPVSFSIDHPGWNINGSAGEGSYMPGNVQIEIQVRPGTDIGAGLVMELESELANVVAHEIHHLTQDGGPLERPNCPLTPSSASGSYFDYFTSACEVPAFLIGFRAQAARTGSSVDELISGYLENQVTADLISGQEADKIAGRWLNHDLWSKQ